MFCPFNALAQEKPRLEFSSKTETPLNKGDTLLTNGTTSILVHGGREGSAVLGQPDFVAMAKESAQAEAAQQREFEERRQRRADARRKRSTSKTAGARARNR